MILQSSTPLIPPLIHHISHTIPLLHYPSLIPSLSHITPHTVFLIPPLTHHLSHHTPLTPYISSSSLRTDSHNGRSQSPPAPRRALANWKSTADEDLAYRWVM